jgi:hypothetical protein
VARYPNRPQALVDYAGVIGVAWLRDASGQRVACSSSVPPQRREGPLSPSEVELDDQRVGLLLRSAIGELPRAPGSPCTEAGKHVVKVDGYTLTILSAAGISFPAIRARLEGCRRLLRSMGDACMPWSPPGGGGGGAGPANAALRVWAPRHRRS